MTMCDSVFLSFFSVEHNIQPNILYINGVIYSRDSHRLLVIAASYFKTKTADILVAYRKSSLLNYAFVCSLLATSESSPQVTLSPNPYVATSWRRCERGR